MIDDLFLLSVYLLLLLLFHSMNFHLFKHKTFSRIIEQFYHEGIFTNKTIFYFSSFSLLFFTPTHSPFVILLHSMEIRRKVHKLVLWISFGWKSFLINGNFSVLWQVSFMEILLWLSYLFDVL